MLPKFRQLQAPIPNEVLILTAPVTDDVPASLLEIPDIRRHRFPVGVDTPGFQIGEKLSDNGWMGLIGVIQKILKNGQRTVFIQCIEPPFKSCFSPIKK